MNLKKKEEEDMNMCSKSIYIHTYINEKRIQRDDKKPRKEHFLERNRIPTDQNIHCNCKKKIPKLFMAE